MESDNGTWYLKSCREDDPFCLHTAEDLRKLIRKIGFLPLFANEIPGFSVEERTVADGWWSGDPETDPWAWRQILSRHKDLAYGKFFNKKAGYVSKQWFPVFANYRRDGYDFEALVGDELASHRAQKIMGALELDDALKGKELLSFELKEKAGFGKGGEKNFEGAITDLQMQTFLLVSDFRQKTNKKGQPYGWHIAAFETPETKWGYEYIATGYKESTEESWRKIVKQVQTVCPEAKEAEIERVMGIRYPGESSKKHISKKRMAAEDPYPMNLFSVLGIQGRSGEGMPDAGQLEGLDYAISERLETERSILKCRYEHHMTYREIAERFRIEEGRVVTIHRKAIRKLKSEKWLPYIRDGYCRVLMDQHKKAEMQEAEEKAALKELQNKSGISDLLSIKLSETGLSVRIVNALKRNDIIAMEDLLRILIHAPEKFERIKNLGAASRKEVFNMLEEHNIFLERF